MWPNSSLLFCPSSHSRFVHTTPFRQPQIVFRKREQRGGYLFAILSSTHPGLCCLVRSLPRLRAGRTWHTVLSKTRIVARISPMGYDFFIGSASPAKPAFDAACATLESQAVGCWITSPDGPSGKPYPEAMENPSAASSPLGVAFSQHTTKSRGMSACGLVRKS